MCSPVVFEFHEPLVSLFSVTVTLIHQSACRIYLFTLTWFTVQRGLMFAFKKAGVPNEVATVFMSDKNHLAGIDHSLCLLISTRETHPCTTSVCAVYSDLWPMLCVVRTAASSLTWTWACRALSASRRQSPVSPCPLSTSSSRTASWRSGAGGRRPLSTSQLCRRTNPHKPLPPPPPPKHRYMVTRKCHLVKKGPHFSALLPATSYLPQTCIYLSGHKDTHFFVSPAPLPIYLQSVEN